MIVIAARRTNEVLALSAARGNRDAFEELVRRHTPSLLAFCRRFSRDRAEAEDRVQDAFIKAYRNLSKFDPSRSFVSWLYKIAQNACLDGIRTRESARPASGGGGQPISSDGEGRLDGAVASLPEKHRAILHYKYGLDMNAAEIAAQMGLTHSDVRVCLHRAIRMLRERLDR